MSKPLLSKITIGFLIFIVAVIIYAATHFNAGEAAINNGQEVALNIEWTLIQEGKEDIVITLPRALLPGSGLSRIETRINKEYSGLVIDLPVNNGIVKVTFNGTLIYDGNRDSKNHKNIIYLPEYGEESTLSVEISPIDTENSIYIQEASLTRGDVAIINTIKESLFPLFLCVLILVSATVVITLEAVRKRSGWEEQNLHILSFFFFTFLIVRTIDTGIPAMLFGNAGTFNGIKALFLASAPISLLLYSYKEERDEKRDRILLLIVAAFVILWAWVPLPLLEKTSRSYIPLSITALYLSIKSIFKKEQYWYIDAIWLLLLGAYALLSVLLPESMLSGKGTLICSLTILISSASQVIKLISDYRAMVEKKEKEAIRASEEKSAFLANMSHEIRTPINAVLGMNEMILRETEDPEIKSYASDIHSAGNTLLSIINDILDLSKIESGKMNIVPVDYETVSLFRDTINMISPKAKAKDLKFNVAIDPKIPTALHGDDVRIRQIMTNILSNAVKYTEKGYIELRASWKSISQSNGRLLIEVKDTGIGIKKEDIPALFDKYSRFDEALHNHTEGTGLGMNITLHMLSLMGSKLKVSSEYGKGSVFRFTLKQGIINKEEIGDFKKKEKSVSGSYTYDGSSFTAPDAKVLVVDDNPMNRKVFRSLLKDTLIRIEEAESGKECIQKTKKTYYDMIFMDHMMPDMDGIETLKKLKGMKSTLCRGTPVFILTANAIAGAEKEYISAGFDGYISKPIIPEKLEKAIRETLPAGLIRKGSGTRAKKEAVSIDIPGIDTDYLSLHFKDPSMQTEALKEFAKGADTNLKKLDTIYNTLNEDKSLLQYRINVHAMKSSAATIGELQLSGLAKTLEDAAKEEDINTIYALHPVFKRAWQSFTRGLNKALGYNYNKGKKRLKPECLNRYLTNLSAAMKESDIDTADEIIKKLSLYQYDKDTQRIMEELREAVNDIDPDKAEELIQALRKTILRGQICRTDLK